MNKKIVTLILVILISFCFLGIVVADNATDDDNNATDHDEKVDETTDKSNILHKGKLVLKNKNADKNKEIDKDNATDKNKTGNESNKNHILAKGNGNGITFSDGFRGYILDYSKSPAKIGDEFRRVSTSTVSNSNTLKLAIIECYKLNSTGQMGKIVSDFVKTGSSNTKSAYAKT